MSADYDPACWSWPLPAMLTREQEVDRLEEESLRLCWDQGTMDHYLPPSACRLLTRDWERYRLSAWHDERCAICDVRPRHLVVDHDHFTGLVRGLLCRGCNISEGARRFDAGAELYENYRERPPAVILDVQVYYVGRGWEHGWWRDLALGRVLTGDSQWVPIDRAA